MTERKTIVVTGGAGFVGRALCLRFRELGYEVVSLSRGDYPEMRALGIRTERVDLAKGLDSCAAILESTLAVFHTAAKVDMWGKYEDFFQTNVVGTRKVLEACIKHAVPRLIFTSSPSVVADGSDLCGINEDYPYPQHFEAFYPQTKAQAEQEVLAANSATLATVALRPHLIWGPGDTNLIPTILERAKSGRLIQVGDGLNKTDICFIDDCVSANVCAFEALRKNPARCSGKAYFISQGEPVLMWPWINDILKAHSQVPITRKVSKRLALFLARIAEAVSRIRPGNPEPRLTQFLVSEMATSHYFDISRAKELLGYTPKYSVWQAMLKTFPQLGNNESPEMQFKKTGSK